VRYPVRLKEFFVDSFYSAGGFRFETEKKRKLLKGYNKGLKIKKQKRQLKGLRIEKEHGI
jgi:hypothetical protein